MGIHIPIHSLKKGGLILQCITRGGKSKKKYPDEETAKTAAQEMERQFHEVFNWYQCIHCGFWHVGRDNGRENIIEKGTIKEGK